MIGIGIHVCEYCGAVHATIGAYLDCIESHECSHSLRECQDVMVSGSRCCIACTGHTSALLATDTPEAGQ